MSDTAWLLEAKRAGNPVPLAALVPYARFMGISAELEGATLVGRMTYSERLIGNATLPALHGGTIGALLETTAVLTLMWEAETASVPRTINLTVDYLRPGRPEDVFAVAAVTKLGRRVANVSVQAWQSDRAKPIALANTHLLLAD